MVIPKRGVDPSHGLQRDDETSPVPEAGSNFVNLNANETNSRTEDTCPRTSDMAGVDEELDTDEKGKAV